ncbi:MAG: arylsulfatase, partial [Planctomycetaceae bacterium]
VNRQYAEHKTWVLTPMLGITERHLQSFRDFPIRQVGLSAQMGKTIEGIQSQILKIRPQH